MKHKNLKLKTSIALVSTALAGTLSGNAVAEQTPFAMQELPSGYMQLAGEGKCGDMMKKSGEGKCGEGKCGEGKCGDMMKKSGEGQAR